MNIREGFVTGSFAVDYYTGNRKYADIDIATSSVELEELSRIPGFRKVTKFEESGNSFDVVENGFVEFGTFRYFRQDVEYNFGYTQEVENYRPIEVFGIKTKIVPPENLIALKLFLNRNTNGKQDFLDAAMLATSCKVDWNKLEYECWKNNLTTELDRLQIYCGIEKKRFVFVRNINIKCIVEV